MYNTAYNLKAVFPSRLVTACTHSNMSLKSGKGGLQPPLPPPTPLHLHKKSPGKQKQTHAVMRLHGSSKLVGVAFISFRFASFLDLLAPLWMTLYFPL